MMNKEEKVKVKKHHDIKKNIGRIIKYAFSIISNINFLFNDIFRKITKEK